MKQKKVTLSNYLLIFLCFLSIFTFGNYLKVSAVENVPQTTELPTQTILPTHTENPEITETPMLTENPEITEAPMLTKNPEITEAPMLTENPEITETPMLTENPLPTKKLSPTASPTPIVCYMKLYDENSTVELYPAISRNKGERWNITLPVPEKKGYTFYVWALTTNKYQKRSLTHYLNRKVSSDVNLMARWKLNEYNITYELNGGSFDNETPTTTYTVNSNVITLPEPVKKKQLFDGWYTTSNYAGNKVTAIASGSTGDVTVYAKWKKAAPSAVNVKSLTNPSRKLVIKLQKVANAKGYEIKISTDKNFKKAVATYDLGKKNSYTLTSVSKKTYYVKARAYAYDSLGNKTYGAYGKTAKKKVSKGAKEYKATSTSAKINKAVVLDTENIQLKATIKKRVKSSDDFYYLVKLNPSTNKVERVVKKVLKEKNLTINLPITNGDVANLLTKYAFAIKQNGKYKLISKPTYITNPEKSAKNTSKLKLPASKKGIQGATLLSGDDDIGTKHTLINLDLKYIVGDSSKASKGSAYSAVKDNMFITYYPYEYNDKTYYFSDYQIGTIRGYTNAGISVSAVILLSWDTDLTYLIHPSARTAGKNYYTLNSEEKKARETLEALFCYLGETFGTSDCYVTNWVLGNEANAHKVWNYAGNLSLDAYTKSYAHVFQMMYYGVKHGYSNTRCFISLDNEWNRAGNGFSGKAFLTSFANAIKKENSKVDWNIAYHAYPAPLTSPAIWTNMGITANANTSTYITPRNLEVLTSYVKKNYGKDTRIILSEQGFTSTSGETIQAAALAYSFYKAQFNPMVDAFIIRSEFDDPLEVSQGLSMGLKAQDRIYKKQAYTVYKYMDTKYAETYTNKYLSTIGAKSWKSIVPGYSASKLKKL